MNDDEQKLFHDLVESHTIAQRCQRLLERTGERFFFQSSKSLSEMSLDERFAVTKQMVVHLRHKFKEEEFTGGPKELLAEMRRLEIALK